jgi:peptide deformylase
MLKLHLVSTHNNILHKDLRTAPADPVDIRKRYYQELKRLCQTHNGYAIAANQVGLELNFFFAMESAKLPNKDGRVQPVCHICAHPTWKPAPGSEQTPKTEGCLSLPGRKFIVPRHTVILATWQNATGHWMRDVKLKGLAAHVFQHEVDHLAGRIVSDVGEEVQG